MDDHEDEELRMVMILVVIVILLWGRVLVPLVDLFVVLLCCMYHMVSY